MRDESTLADLFFYAETLHEQHKLADSIKCYENICRLVSERLRRGACGRFPGRIVPDSLSRIAQIYREQSNLERSVAFLELSNLFAKQLLEPDASFLALLDRLDAEFAVDGSEAQRQARALVETLGRDEREKAAKSRLARWCDAHPAPLAIAGLAILLIVAALLVARASGAQHVRAAAAAERRAQRKRAHSEWPRRTTDPQKKERTAQEPREETDQQQL
jgi:hypothetical protein